MKIDYERGEIRFDFFSAIEYIPKEKLLELVESLACHDKIIEHVSQQIIHGFTENGFYGARAYPIASKPTTGLDWAIREVAKSAGDVAKEEIERLERALKFKEEEVNKLREELYNRSVSRY